MKTTVDIADALLKRAKQVAARKDMTLKELVEAALRDLLDAENREPKQGPLRPLTFRGSGLQAGLSWDDWGTIRDLGYQGRGG